MISLEKLKILPSGHTDSKLGCFVLYKNIQFIGKYLSDLKY